MDGRAGLALALFLAVVAANLEGSSARGEYQVRGRRDPFVRLITSDGRRIHSPGFSDEQPAVGGVAGLALQGIVYEAGRDSYAILNGQIVRARDELNGIQVLAVDAEGVTVRVSGQDHRLTLPESMEEKTES